MEHRRTARKFKHKLANLFEMPKDLILDLPRINIIGNLQLTVENHRGIVHYDNSSITVGVLDGQVYIEGEELVIGNIYNEQIVVTGKISSLRFLR